MRRAGPACMRWRGPLWRVDGPLGLGRSFPDGERQRVRRGLLLGLPCREAVRGLGDLDLALLAPVEPSIFFTLGASHLCSLSHEPREVSLRPAVINTPRQRYPPYTPICGKGG